MEPMFLEYLASNPFLFLLISVTLNIIIAISGIIPSAFLTAANITVFGFKIGLALSIIGEALGAIISFLLYRKGIRKLSTRFTSRNRFLLALLERLKNTEGLGAIFLVLILRIMPFIPSGAVTLAAALSKIGIWSFAISSTIGKFPALYIEAYTVNEMLDFSTEFQIVSITILLVLWGLYYVMKKDRCKTE
jgi:uncharacterized membrane protein YdjX (TVP38/TMEM64 family)